ncbi:MAG: dimethylargininase [Acidobacteriia bacterium]|nr:dimethylargininase [Terriglobia bacterium]
MLTAITRAVSPEINRCELGYLPRVPIDVAKAIEQHRQYEACLEDLGVKVISLPAEPSLPDCMFVEDPAVLVDEIAVMTRMGAESRRREVERLSTVLARFRRLRWMREPATLEGGDVLRMGRVLYVGLSARTNQAGIDQLAVAVEPLGYSVRVVPVRGCLHLKSGCSALDDRTILANREWIDAGAFSGVEIVDVAPEEPGAANVLTIGDTALVPAAFPLTAGRIAARGWRVRRLDISELQKAEAGLTCSSILFETGESG